MKRPRYLDLSAAVIATLGWIGAIGALHYLSAGFLHLLSGVDKFGLYFTNWASIMTAVVFTGIAAGNVQLSRRTILGHVVVTLAIVFAMYWSFQGLDHFFRSPFSQKIVHLLLFPMVGAYWLVTSRYDTARWRNIPTWTFWPLLYTVYGMSRGYLTGSYPYEQANIEVFGAVWILGIIAATAIAALAFGALLVFWDKRLGPIVAQRLGRGAAPRCDGTT